MKVSFYTLGCKVNQYETDVMRCAFESRGYVTACDDDDADIYVINSCTVTSMADKKSRQKLRHFKRANPNGIIVLTGCFAQVYADKASEIKEADIIVGVKNRAKLPQIVEQYLCERKRTVDVVPHEKTDTFEDMNCSVFYEKTRAFIKIQDGCNRFCSYCAIPLARGRVRSKQLSDLKRELNAVTESGYKEVVLVGINLACYGQDINARLIDAVTMTCNTSGIERVRLGSFEPEMLIEEDLDKMSRLEHFCPHFHISLQSGCDATLKRMNRHYDSSQYMDIVKTIRCYFKSPAITTDVIVGFPGETDEEFSQSCKFIESVGFSKIHIFPYSRREGTAADKMPNQIDNSVKAKRAKILQKTADDSEKTFLQSKVGQTVRILAEALENNTYTGFTADYVPVRIVGNFADSSLQNTFIYAKIIGIDNEFCIGEII